MISGVGGRVPLAQENCRVPWDRVRFTQLAVLQVESTRPLRFARSQPSSPTRIDLRLAHPPTQRRSPKSKHCRHALAGGRYVWIFIKMVKHEPHHALPRLFRDPHWHDHYFRSKLERKRHQTGEGSLFWSTELWTLVCSGRVMTSVWHIVLFPPFRSGGLSRYAEHSPSERGVHKQGTGRSEKS